LVEGYKYNICACYGRDKNRIHYTRNVRTDHDNTNCQQQQLNLSTKGKSQITEYLRNSHNIWASSGHRGLNETRKFCPNPRSQQIRHGGKKSQQIHITTHAINSRKMERMWHNMERLNDRIEIANEIMYKNYSTSRIPALDKLPLHGTRGGERGGGCAQNPLPLASSPPAVDARTDPPLLVTSSVDM
jgi:hypothetical protein